MKNYDLVVSSVKRVKKFNSKDFVMGYILALWDWDTIDNDSYKTLKDLMDDKGELT